MAPPSFIRLYEATDAIARLAHMTPKTPKQLRDEIEAANEQPAEEGHEYTAEGKKVPTPTKGDFFSNLEKASKPDSG